MRRASALAGLPLAELAGRLGEPVPSESRRAKGWAGTLLEAALGADASSLPEPDFTGLGIELKTIPLTAAGRPRESTYVCTAPLVSLAGADWAGSLVRRKLARVLWIPILSEPGLAVGERRIGRALLWSPTPAQDAALQADWNELMDLLALGSAEAITGALGQVLQVRPKAANARARTRGHDASGRGIDTLPRGFYLRAGFTAAIIAGAAASVE